VSYVLVELISIEHAVATGSIDRSFPQPALIVRALLDVSPESLFE
jgi:hypothetical protein